MVELEFVGVQYDARVVYDQGSICWYRGWIRSIFDVDVDLFPPLWNSSGGKGVLEDIVK